MSIYNNEQGELNQAFNAEGNFDGLNEQISVLEVQDQVNQMQPITSSADQERPTRVLELSHIQAALQAALEAESNKELQAVQRELNQAFKQR